MNKRPSAREALARNLRALMDWKGIKQPELARRTHGRVGQKTISNMLDPDGHSPTLDSIEAVAQVFGLQAWQLQMPLPENLEHCSTLADLINHFIGSAPDGQDFIVSTADREHRLRPRRDSGK